MNQDQEHLKLLSIFHYVAAGIIAVFSLIPIFHLGFGLMMVLAPETFQGNGEAAPEFLGWMFIGFAVAFIVTGWVFAALVFSAGRFLVQRKRYTFCMVVAGLECLVIPLGTVLGVFTIVVLMRDSVKALFYTDSTVPEVM